MSSAALRFRALACAVFLPVLAGCEHFSGVRRTAPRPADFDELLALGSLADHPHRDKRYERLGEAVFVLGDGAAHAWFACNAQTLEVSSAWASVPDAAVLDRSLQLQDEIIARLRARWPALPAADAWLAEWLRDGATVPDRASLLGAR